VYARQDGHYFATIGESGSDRVESCTAADRGILFGGLIIFSLLMVYFEILSYRLSSLSSVGG